jgi:hypothetical protein
MNISVVLVDIVKMLYYPLRILMSHLKSLVLPVVISSPDLVGTGGASG